MTLADGLSVLRLALVTPIVAIEVNAGDHRIALALFLAAVLTDALDGPIARARGGGRVLGSILDPLADSVLVLGTLAPGAGRGAWIAVPLAVLVGRDLAVLRLRLRLAAQGIALPASALGKLKTALLDLACVWYLLAQASAAFVLFVLFWVFLSAGVALALATALRYADLGRRAHA